MKPLHRLGDLVVRLTDRAVERAVVVFRCLDEFAAHVGGLQGLLECGRLLKFLLAIVRYDQEERRNSFAFCDVVQGRDLSPRAFFFAKCLDLSGVLGAGHHARHIKRLGVEFDHAVEDRQFLACGF